jgi:hypothetical protein
MSRFASALWIIVGCRVLWGGMRLSWWLYRIGLRRLSLAGVSAAVAGFTWCVGEDEAEWFLGQLSTRLTWIEAHR